MHSNYYIQGDHVNPKYWNNWNFKIQWDLLKATKTLIIFLWLNDERWKLQNVEWGANILKILFLVQTPRRNLETLLRKIFQLQFRPPLTGLSWKRKKESQAKESYIFLGKFFIYWQGQGGCLKAETVAKIKCMGLVGSKETVS